MLYQIYRNMRFLILVDISVLLVPFVIGLIHPYAVLFSHVFLPFFGIFVFIIFIISIVKLIRDLFKKEKKVLFNLSKVGCCFILYLIFCLWHNITFAGLLIHYSFIKDYDVIRTWHIMLKSLIFK